MATTMVTTGAEGELVRSRSRLLSGIIAGAISIAFIALALRNVDAQNLWLTASQCTLWPLALTQVAKAAGMLLMAVRTRAILDLKALGVGGVFRGHLEAFAVNSALPFRLGELYRVHYIAVRGNVSYAASVAAAALERLCDMLSLLGLFVIALLLSAKHAPIPIALYGLAAALIAVTAAVLVTAHRPAAFVRIVSVLSGIAGERAQRVVTGVAEQFAQGLVGLTSFRRVSQVFVLSLGYWSTAALSATLVLVALGIRLPPQAAFVVLGFLAFGTALPSSPAFVGTYHFFAAAALTSVYGVDPTRAASFALICHAVAFVPFAVAGGASLARDRSLFRSLGRAAKAVSVRPPPPE